MLENADLQWVQAGTGAMGIQAPVSAITGTFTEQSGSVRGAASGVFSLRHSLKVDAAKVLIRARDIGIPGYRMIAEERPTPKRTLATARDYRVELLEVLESIATLTAGWNGADAPKPRQKSINSAKVVVRALPTTNAKVKIGVGGDGNVFIHATNGDSNVYITVEHNRLHLLGKNPRREAQYIDSEPFNRRIVPPGILDAFQKNLAN
jgi:hypothetical protein